MPEPPHGWQRPMRRSAQAPPDPVADHGMAGLPPDRERNARWCVGAVMDEPERHRAGPATPGPGQGLEGRTIANAPDQAESRFRPRARRSRSTARPPRVRIRIRKPWVFLRFRLLGWNVRFTRASSRRRAQTVARARAEGGKQRSLGGVAAGRNARPRLLPVTVAGAVRAPFVALVSAGGRG